MSKKELGSPIEGCNHDFVFEADEINYPVYRYVCRSCQGRITEESFEMFIQGYQLGRRGYDHVPLEERH